MPVISVFHGLIVRMYFFNLKQQTRPHVHVAYADASAIFSIDDAALLAGEIPLKQTRLVQAWIELRREELLADWNQVASGAELFNIEPLR